MCIYAFARDNPLNIKFLSEFINLTFSGNNVVAVDMLVGNPSAQSLPFFYLLYPNSRFKYGVDRPRKPWTHHELDRRNIKLPRWKRLYYAARYKISRKSSEYPYALNPDIPYGIFVDCSFEWEDREHPGNLFYTKYNWDILPNKNDRDSDGNIRTKISLIYPPEMIINDQKSIDGYFTGNSIITLPDKDWVDCANEIGYSIFKIDLKNNPLRKSEDRWFRFIFRPLLCISSRPKGFKKYHLLWKEKIIYKYPAILGPSSFVNKFHQELDKVTNTNLSGARITLKNLTRLDRTNYCCYYILDLSSGHISSIEPEEVNGNLEKVSGGKRGKISDDESVYYTIRFMNKESIDELKFTLSFFGIFETRTATVFWGIFFALLLSLIGLFKDQLLIIIRYLLSIFPFS